MEDVIARIVEIERQCAEDVEKAERESRSRVQEFRRTLEEKQSREAERIVASCSERLEKAVEAAKKLIDSELQAVAAGNEKIFQDIALKESIRAVIASILLDPREP